jgi:hypothetical protein
MKNATATSHGSMLLMAGEGRAVVASAAVRFAGSFKRVRLNLNAFARDVARWRSVSPLLPTAKLKNPHHSRRCSPSYSRDRTGFADAISEMWRAQ